jgi:hypothetical protein
MRLKLWSVEFEKPLPFAICAPPSAVLATMAVVGQDGQT